MVLMILIYILLGLIGGLHRASYGAYKDSPYENFYIGRFLRDLIIGVLAAIIFFNFGWGKNEPLLILALTFFSISYIIVEVWKVFIRYKDESDYRIPVRMHIGGKAVESHLIRALFALIFIGVIYGIYKIGILLPESIDIIYKGMIMGFLITLFEAIGGGYKDGTIEGFKLITFLRSPMLGIIGGFLMALITKNLALILLGLLAFERIIIETRKFFKGGYMPGKFIQGKVVYQEWMKKRWIFLIPYTSTWIGFIVLLILYFY